MISTIPPHHLRPSQQFKPKSQSTGNRARANVANTNGVKKRSKRGSGPLAAVGVIVSVAVVGLVVLRVSRASTLPGSYTPQQLEAAQKQTGVQVAATQTLNVSGVTPLRYTPTSDTESFVAYYIDGKLLAVVNKQPFVFDFDSTTVSNGSHELQLLVFDQAGNVVTTKGYTLNVQNSSDPVHEVQKIIIGQ